MHAIAPHAQARHARPLDRTGEHAASAPQEPRAGLRVVGGAPSGPYTREEVRRHGRAAIEHLRADRERRHRERAEARAA